MTHVTCRLTAKNRDQLRNPTLGNHVWATFTFFVVMTLVGFHRSVMQQIVSSVMCNNLLVPIQKILSERSKHLARSSGSKMMRFRSVYRDVLFLTFVALGQPNISIGKFCRICFAHLMLWTCKVGGHSRAHCSSLLFVAYVSGWWGAGVVICLERGAYLTCI